MPHSPDPVDEVRAAAVGRMQQETYADELKVKPEKIWVPATLVVSIIVMVWILANWFSENRATIKKLQEDVAGAQKSAGAAGETTQALTALKAEEAALRAEMEALRKEAWQRKHMRQWVREAKRIEPAREFPDPDEIVRQFE